jgi:hypothetical protein
MTELFPPDPTCPHGRTRPGCPFCRTRRTDPPESLNAARTALQSPIRQTVLELLRNGPLTDDQIVKWFAEHGHAGSPSGIRTRRKELTDDGHVHRHAVDGLSPHGRAAARWYAYRTGP